MSIRLLSSGRTLSGMNRASGCKYEEGFCFKSTQIDMCQRGFSLIELLVVIAIISILSSIVLAGLGDSRNQKDVDSAASLVAAQLREMQTSALTGKQYIAGTTPCRYQGAWAGNTFSTHYWYKDSSEDCTRSSAIQTTPLPGGVAASSSGSSSVFFRLPHGQVGSAEVITFTKGSSSGVVCIGADGAIKTERTASSC